MFEFPWLLKNTIKRWDMINVPIKRLDIVPSSPMNSTSSWESRDPEIIALRPSAMSGEKIRKNRSAKGLMIKPSPFFGEGAGGTSDTGATDETEDMNPGNLWGERPVTLP